MGYWEDNLQNITSNNDLAALSQFKVETPDLIDRAMMKHFGGSYDGLLAAKEARIAQLQQQEAAPIIAEASRLKNIIANDPYVGSAEGLADFAQRPGYWLGTDSGAGAAGKGNPYIAKAVQSFGDQSQNILDAFKVQQQDPMAIARMSQNKDAASGFDNTTQGMERFAKRADTQTEQSNLSNFLDSAAMMNAPSQRTGKMMPYGEAAALINQAAADYPVKPEVVNQSIDNLLKQYVNTRSPVKGKTGRTTWTGTENLMGDINKDVGSTAPNISIDTGGRDKNPVLYLIQKPDGRTVQVDATTAKGRARMDSAIQSGERITRLGSESVSETTVGDDGRTTTRRATGAIAPAKTERPAITVVRDPKTGRMVIKR